MHHYSKGVDLPETKHKIEKADKLEQQVRGHKQHNIYK